MTQWVCPICDKKVPKGIEDLRICEDCKHNMELITKDEKRGDV